MLERLPSHISSNMIGHNIKSIMKRKGERGWSPLDLSLLHLKTPVYPNILDINFLISKHSVNIKSYDISLMHIQKAFKHLKNLYKMDENNFIQSFDQCQAYVNNIYKKESKVERDRIEAFLS